jgi:hypothetical protein
MNKSVDLNNLNFVNEQEQVQGLLASSAQQQEEQESMEVTE